MDLNPIDQEFLRVNAELKLISPERIAAAQKIQAREVAAGAPMRSLIDVLRVQGVIDQDTEARFRVYLASGASREISYVQVPDEHEDTPLPSHDTLLDMSFPTDVPAAAPAAPPRARKSLYCPRCSVRMSIEVRPDVPVYRCGTCQAELVDPPPETQVGIDESKIVNVMRDPLPPEVRAVVADPAAKFGKYIIVSELGHGGIGQVHKAWDTYFGQYVALKRAKAVQAKPADQEVYIESLLKEARSLVLLRHPNIVAVYDIGRIQGQLYLSMEYIEGRTLASDVREARARSQISSFYSDPARHVRYMRDITRALQYAHTLATPVIHCDLKPSNVLIDKNDRAVLLDFGLAHKMRSLQKESSGVVSGTPSYMAPEQASGRPEDIDARTDIYGLGAMLYELLTGRPPFVGSMQSVLRQTLLDQPERPSEVMAALGAAGGDQRKGTLSALEDLCLKCLEKDRSMRWQTAGEVGDVLERILKDCRPKASDSTVLLAPVGALPNLDGGRKALACRGAYVYLRRTMQEPKIAAALAGAAYQWAAAGQVLREGTIKAAARLTPEVAEGAPENGDCAAIEPLLTFYDPDPMTAYGQAWSSETVRTALGIFHRECERSGRRDLYNEIHAGCGFGGADAVAGRLQRRARRRFREILRDLVGQTLRVPDGADAEMKALLGLLPVGSSVCRRCEGAYDPQAVATLFAGFCPGCVIRLGLEPPPPIEEVGPYEILGSLGTDAMGEIYRARGQDDPQEHALRILPNRQMVEQARSAMRVRHRAAISVLDAGDADGKAYVVAELVEGTPLRDVVAEKSFPRDRAIQIVTALSEAVERIHEAGLVHGSLDPSKVIIDRNGEPHIGDFGYVRPSPEARGADIEALSEIFAACVGNPLAGWEGPSAQEFVANLRREHAGQAQPERAAPVPSALRPEPGKSPVVPIVVGVIVVVGLAVGAVAYFGAGDRKKETLEATRPVVNPRDRALGELDAVFARAAARTDLEKCAQETARFVKEWPDDVHGPLVAAYIEFARFDFPRAEAEARRALMMDERASPAWRIIGLVAMERLDYAAARDALTRGQGRYIRWSLKHEPWDKADEFLAQGLLFYAQGDPAQAARAIESANEARVSAESCRWMGFMAATPKTNIRFQTDALGQRPEYTPARVERGIAYVAAGEYDAAIEDLDKALKVFPDDGRALLSRALARKALGRLEAAQEDLSRVVELTPKLASGWLERSKVRYRRGDFQGAVDDAKKAIEISPSTAECHLEHGRALWKLKKPKQAELSFSTAVRLDPRLRTEVEKIRKE